MALDPKLSVVWFASKQSQSSQHVAATRDIFQARLDSLLRQLIKIYSDVNQCSLIGAVAGELGNNCFDHNLGHWHDAPGCYFEYCLAKDSVDLIMADRGQGIFSSLKRVDPLVVNAKLALETAFSKVISGRYPENRGNGLKFVRMAINGHDGCGLCCFSDGEFFCCGREGDNLKALLQKELPTTVQTQGTYTLVRWRIK